MSEVECKCKTCKKPFMAKIADRRRGWGKFCSKSCKAIKQTRRHTAMKNSGQIVNRKAWLKAKAERNPDALTSRELEELGAAKWEVQLAEHEEALDDAFPLGENF